MSELEGRDPDVITDLLEAASEVMSETNLEGVLERLLTAAREVCGARYAALGLDASRSELERFITGEAGASELSEADDAALVLLPGFAAVAIEHARRFSEVQRRQRELERSIAALDATAVATARSVEADRRSQRLAAAEQERSRWARELHDETLQNLAALRLGICAQLRSDDLPAMKSMLAESLESLEEEIASLRSLIHELRPTALDDLGLGAALEDLASRAAARGVIVELDLDLAYEQGREAIRHHDETETAVYRIVQEALTNAIRHGRAARARVRLRDDNGILTASINDDGSGFDTGALSTGFGLTSMRERAELAGGTLEVRSEPGSGTTVEATIPARRIPRVMAS